MKQIEKFYLESRAVLVLILILSSTAFFMVQSVSAQVASTSGNFTAIDYPMGYNTYITGINNLGQIVGTYLDSSLKSHTFLFSSGNYSKMEYHPDGVTADVSEISNSGQIVGYYDESSGKHYAYLFSSGNYTKIEYPGGSYTTVIGINDLGQIVGNYAEGQEMLHRGYLLSSGKYTKIDYPGAVDTTVTGINNLGQIVGVYGDGAKSHGYILSSGNYTAIDYPMGYNTYIIGINNLGQIVGTYQDVRVSPLNHQDSLVKSHAFLLSSGKYTQIDYPGAVGTDVIGINDLGQIAGNYQDNPGAIQGDHDSQRKNHGYLLSSGKYTKIDYPGAVETRVVGINNLGQIAGNYQDNSKMNYHGYLFSSFSTKVTPEFGSTSFVILTISILSIIMFSIKTRFSLKV